jgi:hypothetical protein
VALNAAEIQAVFNQFVGVSSDPASKLIHDGTLIINPVIFGSVCLSL